MIFNDITNNSQIEPNGTKRETQSIHKYKNIFIIFLSFTGGSSMNRLTRLIVIFEFIIMI
jgi:hypothetical protein